MWVELCFWGHTSHLLIKRYSQSSFYATDWSKFDRWVHAEIYTASWNLFTLTAEADRVLCQLVMFNCLFPLDVQNEIQLLSGVFCYSWLVCVLNFWLRNASLVKVSFRFRMASFSFITLLVTKEGWIVSSRDSGVSC